MGSWCAGGLQLEAQARGLHGGTPVGWLRSLQPSLGCSLVVQSCGKDGKVLEHGLRASAPSQVACRAELAVILNIMVHCQVRRSGNEQGDAL